ncbi:class I SAM-dependent methyltransferase [Chondromyces apiculatus]|uniref:Methyltransferase n=1 Tax=Chondromyces apiculatus DSM 436 TaxID=1192034 RepID=A0A017SW64_9BACT|nr:class I SAM-dependent methyltransferase [Chondromyces apiculatus]EYF01204.1 Methyltransferase [Chondromyces apiculatus DSM 436]
MSLHHLAAQGFSAAADAYERGRPDYPPRAIEILADSLRLQAGRALLELGAGTGKMTRLLVPTGARILAMEPVEEMRGKLAQAAPSVEVLDGVAEAIPIPDASVDAVVAAQSFHWFHADLALPQIHRVLRPGGRMALVWNMRDARVPWVARLSEILDRHGREAPHSWSGAWRADLASSALFEPVVEREISHSQDLDGRGLAERAASISYIAALPPAEQALVLAEVRALADEHPDLRGRATFPFPYRTVVAVYASRSSR